MLLKEQHIIFYRSFFVFSCCSVYVTSTLEIKVEDLMVLAQA